MIRTFQDEYGVQVLHAWGMTEMSPVGTVAALKSKHLDLPHEAQFAIQSKQGRAVYGVDMKIVGDNGEELPWDGKASGELMVRGPWIVSQYFKNEGGDPLVADHLHVDAVDRAALLRLDRELCLVALPEV